MVSLGARQAIIKRRSLEVSLVFKGKVEVIFNVVHASFSHSLLRCMQDFQSFGLPECRLSYNA